MRTKILLNNLLLQEVPATPSETLLKLENHFRRPWDHLAAQGLRLSPPAAKNIIEECTEPDGTVWGVRFFVVYPPGYLVSPTSRWVWESAEQIVPEFGNSEAVRGHHGFHAAWPKSLQDWVGSTVDHPDTNAKALVKGHGDIVVGEVGFRSSKMTVIAVCLHERDPMTTKQTISDLTKRYPELLISTTAAPFSGQAFWFDFPHDLRKVAKWLRDKSLRSLATEF